MINPNTIVEFSERMLKVLNFDGLIQKYIQISSSPIFL